MTKKARTLDAVITEAYESGINVAIMSFLPDGIEVKIGDERVGIRAETIFSSRNMPNASTWLIDHIRKHYPQSAFAKVAWA